MWRAWIIPVAMLSACGEFPEVDAALAKGDPESEYPALLPFEQLVSADDPRLSDSEDEALLARADDLKGRADALRRPVIDEQTQDRMDGGVTLP